MSTPTPRSIDRRDDDVVVPLRDQSADPRLLSTRSSRRSTIDTSMTVLSIPPGVVHGVQATGGQSAVLVNAVDRAYSYSAPDHHRLPLDSPEIPYRF